MEYEHIQMLTKMIFGTLLPILLIILFMWTGNWKMLLVVSIFIALIGFSGRNLFMVLDAAGATPESSLHSVLGLAIVDFLRAIFVLLLAIFTWLRKESISIVVKQT